MAQITSAHNLIVLLSCTIRTAIIGSNSLRCPATSCNSEYLEFPCRSCTDDAILDAKTYSFVDESHFIIEMEWRKELYAFALDLKNRAWTALPIKIPRFGGYFVSVKGRYVLSPESVFDLGDNGFLAEDAYDRDGFFYSYRVPLSTFDRSNVPEWEDEREPIRRIVPLGPVLENDGQVCNTCVLQLETDGVMSEGRVLIDVCRTELTTLNTTVSNCLRLHIDYLDVYDISLVSV